MLTWAALIAVAAIAWGVFRATALQPIRPPTGERHGPTMLASQAARDAFDMADGILDGQIAQAVIAEPVPLTWEFVTGPSPCAFLTETSDNNGRRVVVDFDCVRAKWPDASMLVTDHGVTVMLDDVMALCGPGISLRCAVR
jgi:hypothetical protein